MGSQYEKEIAWEAKRMTRKEVMLKAINKQISWIQASEILGITARQMRRVRVRYERQGYDGLADHSPRQTAAKADSGGNDLMRAKAHNPR